MEIELKGRIDSNNTQSVEEEIRSKLPKDKDSQIEFNMERLEYISSAGLRVILRIFKEYPNLSLINVQPEVYEIMDMTGFTEMMKVKRAYKSVSIEGCEEIGRGANGIIYRIDQDNVVKVYLNEDPLSEIEHEREVAKLALVLGIPTAIAYDVVKVGDYYGSVFELLNATSFAKILARTPEKIDWCVDEFVKMLRKIHATEVPEGKLPRIKETALEWAAFMKDYLDAEEYEKLYRMVSEIPESNYMIHGDYHTKNIEQTDSEILIIDMDTLAVGDPIFELAGMFNSFVGFNEYDHDLTRRFQGFDFEIGVEFWEKSLAKYLKTSSQTKIKEVEDKARVIGYTRMIRRAIRRNHQDTEDGRKEIEMWTTELKELLQRVDSLILNPNELDIEATKENLDEVQTFIKEKLEETNCSEKTIMQLEIAIEEIFVNIASYAYSPEIGKVIVRVEVSGNPVSVTITFIDHGVQYDPLAKEDPDIALPASERSIGGLGIFMTKQLMDDLTYEYKDGQNILTLKKNL